MNFTWFSLEYVDHEEKSSNNLFEPRFGGHQSLEDRENSFYAKNQTIHCGFVKGPPGYSSTGFDLDEKDKAYMFSCKFSVSSCIFGSSDFLRRPTSRLVIQQLFIYLLICFVLYISHNEEKISFQSRLAWYRHAEMKPKYPNVRWSFLDMFNFFPSLPWVLKSNKQNCRRWWRLKKLKREETCRMYSDSSFHKFGILDIECWVIWFSWNIDNLDRKSVV